MNSFQKTYYWLIPIGILSGLLTCFMVYFAVKSNIGIFMLLALILPGLMLTLLNTFIFVRTNQMVNGVFKTSILGGLLTLLIYIASAFIVLPMLQLTEEFIVIGLIGLVSAVIARLFFSIQFKVPTKRLNMITVSMTGFYTGLIISFLFEMESLHIELLPDLWLNLTIGYTLFTTLFNTCILLAFTQKNYTLVHGVYLLTLTALIIDLFLRIG